MFNLLDTLVEKNRKYGREGKLASYIPALLEANPNDLGIYVIDSRGKEYYSGEYDKKFTIQSISKIITLILAIKDNGRENVFKKVDVEPTGMGFNSIVNLENSDSGRPYNPMINAGAIVTTSLIDGKDVDERLEKILDFMKLVMNNESITLNESVYLSEKQTGNKNRALAYFMKSTGALNGDVEEILDLYFKQCSIEVTARDLARFGAVLANDGVLP